MKRRKYFGLLFFAIVLVIGSCSTIPKNTAQVSSGGDFSLLPTGGQLYLWADVNEARVLLESINFNGISLNQAAAIIDRTDTAAAVFFPKDSSGSLVSERPNNNFFISLRGKFPTFQAGFSFTFSRDWKKLKSNTGNSYWYSQGFGLGLALDSQLALVSGGDPFSRLPSSQNQTAVRLPDGFDKFREQYKPQGAVMAGWIPDSDLINGLLSDFGLPISIPAEDFFFCVLKRKTDGKDSWELVFNMRTASVNQARGLVSVFTLARAFISALDAPGAEKSSIMDFLPALFANIPEREEATLTLKSDIFSTGDLSLLFSAISVYSKQ